MSCTTGRLTVLHLYPTEMGLYGDRGNAIALRRRITWHGYAVQVLEHHAGAPFPSTDIDIVVGGGGQDSSQESIHGDLMRIAPDLRRLAGAQVSMLVVCGLYQLFGHRCQMRAGTPMEGVGLLDIETRPGDRRHIGNIVTWSSRFDQLVGFENHSGQTLLGPAARPLAKVVQGAGNNGTDHTEGAVQGSIIGTYLHGSFLPRNPQVADALIEAAAVRRFGSFVPELINDGFADAARPVAAHRPR